MPGTGEGMGVEVGRMSGVGDRVSVGRRVGVAVTASGTEGAADPHPARSRDRRIRTNGSRFIVFSMAL
jgi:hypothetical protein